MALPTRVNVVAAADWSGGSAITVAAAATNHTTGNVLVVAAGGNATSGQSITGVTDTAGNTYVKVDAVIGPDNYREELWYAKTITGHAANVVTVTWSATVAYRGIAVVQYAGADPVSPFEATAKGTAAAGGTTVTTGTLTTTRPNTVQVIVPRWGYYTLDTITWPAGFARITTGGDLNVDVAEAFVSGTTAAPCTITHTYTAIQKQALVAAFAGTPSGPAASVRVSQDAIELLSFPTPAARVSQGVVEVLGGSVSSAAAEARVTQTVAELLTLSPPGTESRLTQLVTELITLLPPPVTRVTQLAVEVFYPVLVPVRATQQPVELFDARPASLRVSQEPVEVFLVPRPRRLIRRLRRAPHVHDEHRRIAYAKFALDLQRGVGALAGQGANPVVTLRVSRDGGQTWSEPVTMRAGTLGASTTRVLARRLGHARDAVFEVTVSDPVAWSLVQAWLDLEPGTS